MGTDVVNVLAEAHHPGVGQLLEHHAVVREAAPAAAVGVRYVAEQEAHRTDLAPRRGIDAMRLLPRRLPGCELVGDETPDGVAKRLELVVLPG